MSKKELKSWLFNIELTIITYGTLCLLMLNQLQEPIYAIASLFIILVLYFALIRKAEKKFNKKW